MMKTTILSLLLAGASAFAPPAAQVRTTSTTTAILSLSSRWGLLFRTVVGKKEGEGAAGSGWILVPYARSSREATL